VAADLEPELRRALAPKRMPAMVIGLVVATVLSACVALGKWPPGGGCDGGTCIVTWFITFLWGGGTWLVAFFATSLGVALVRRISR